MLAIYIESIGFKYSRRVGLESTAAQSQRRPVLRHVPNAMASLQELILRRGVIHQVGKPTVPFPYSQQRLLFRYMLDSISPSRLSLRCVVFRFLIVDPSCPD